MTEPIDKPVNGHALGGAQLEQALKHDAAGKQAQVAGERVFATQAVVEAFRVPCPTCLVKEYQWCVDSVPAPLPNGEMVADFCHAERVKLARAAVSRAVEQRLAELLERLPRGEALKSQAGQWPAIVEYANTFVQRAMAEALETIGRQLGVEPSWIASLPNKLVEMRARATATAPIANPPVPPAAGVAAADPSDALKAMVAEVERRYEERLNKAMADLYAKLDAAIGKMPA